MRVNISLVEDDGTVTKVNEAGPTLDEAAIEGLLERVESAAAGAGWVVGCGSLPPGMDPAFYGRVARSLPAGIRMAIDASGPALAAAAEAGVALLKPNRTELEELTGRALSTIGAVVDAAAALLDAGTGAVLTSLGPDGAVYVWAGGAVHAEARIDDVANTVGAGDALLAGFLAAGADADAVVTAVAWGVAACRSPGTRMRPVRDEDVAAVVRHARIDRSRRLA
jgi:1-phosphofructokinase